MFVASHSRRVIVASGNGEERFQDLFRREPLKAWEAMTAKSFSQARFLLQHNRCDLLMVNDDLLETEGSQGLAWLAGQPGLPMVFLAGSKADSLARALQIGISVCLDHDKVMAHPQTLAAGFEQAIRVSELQYGYQTAKEQLTQAHRNMDRLVSMLWRTTPKPDNNWFPQRYMLERLTEELARTERYKLPFTLALGEVQPPAPEVEPAAEGLPEWAPEAIIRSKRRCDVVGQYGVQAFMLLMVQTGPEGGVNCCRRLQKVLLAPPHPLQGPHQSWKASFGVASITPDKNTPQALLRCAEERLEQARLVRENAIVDR